MMYANEARNLSNANNKTKDTIKSAIAKILPLIDERINKLAAAGFRDVIIQKKEIMSIVGFVWVPAKDIMDAIVAEVANYGYKTFTTASYSSVHIEW